jgi:hypothetical protein
MVSRSIKIVKLPDGTTAFKPDVVNATPGQPLGANVDDTLTWDNQTKENHWPVAIEPPLFLTDDISPGDVSDPIFIIPSSLKYCCRHHPWEQGRIIVSQSSVRMMASSPAGAGRPKRKAAGRKRKAGGK